MPTNDSPQLLNAPRSFWWFVLVPGLLWFGIGASVIFIILSLVRDTPNFWENSWRITIAFLVCGIPFGALAWLVDRLARRMKRSKTEQK